MQFDQKRVLVSVQLCDLGRAELRDIFFLKFENRFLNLRELFELIDSFLC